MPETRKHHREARDALDEAVLAALGEPVRPIPPGETPPTPVADEPVAAPASTALGSFTWTFGAATASGAEPTASGDSTRGASGAEPTASGPGDAEPTHTEPNA